MKRQVISCILILLLCTVAGKADNWTSYIINYQKALYGNGSQTWQVKSYNNRWMFFANQNGLVQFDGATWSIYPVHNGTCIRSIFPSYSKGRIYVGGINEFGYFAPGENGKLVYHCLSEQLNGKQNLLGNIWNIFESENTLYVVGDNKIIKCMDGRYSLIDAKTKIDCSGMSNGVLYIGTAHGIYILVGRTVMSLQSASILKDKRIRNILPYGNSILIVTAFDGVYCYDGQSTRPFITGMESFLKQNEIFCAAISGDKFAAGSIRNGIATVNLRNHEVKYFNERNGMQNNTVLSASFDYWGNLWAGLDSNGLDYILLNSPLTNLYSFPNSYGTGYSAMSSGNLLYLGTNRGLFYMPFDGTRNGELPNITTIKGGGGQVWSINRIGSEIFCAHDRGLFKLQGANMTRITDVTGVWTCQEVKGKQNMMYVGVYDGMYIFEKRGNNWAIRNKIAGIGESCRSFAQASAREIWIANGSRLEQFVLDGQLKSIVRSRTFNLHDLIQVNKDTKVYSISNRIIIATTKGLYQYNRKSGQIEPSNFLPATGGENISCITQYNNSIITLTPEYISFYSAGNGKFVSSYLTSPSLPMVLDAENIVPVSDSTMIIPNDEGFALFKIPSKKRNIDYSGLLHIRNVYLTYPKDSLIYTDNFLAKKDIPSISFNRNSIRFEYSIASFANTEGVVYQYRLNNNEWSDNTTSTTKEFSKLNEGKYTFEVRATLPNGKIISTDSFTFRILPPWYRSIWAYIIYILLFGILLRYIYLWDDTRVKNKKRQAVKEKDRQMKVMEQKYAEDQAEKDRQIMELEKEKLEYDLQHKSQEMANLMINFVRKNEILTEIRSDLFKVLGSLRGESNKESKQMLILVRNKIESNIQGDEVLKKIEDQFDVVHNNFMKRLREKHPDLSNNERMMCAYLKMNLSTKEIAPLLNISIRGVETIRYRLRKKFELEREDSLLEYLNSF